MREAEKLGNSGSESRVQPYPRLTECEQRVSQAASC